MNHVEKENETDQNFVVTYNIPSNAKPENINIQYGQNSVMIEFDIEETSEKNGAKHFIRNSGRYVRRFPFEIVDPKAKIENDMLVINFEKGENLELPYKKLQIQ